MQGTVKGVWKQGQGKGRGMKKTRKKRQGKESNLVWNKFGLCYYYSWLLWVCVCACVPVCLNVCLSLR